VPELEPAFAIHVVATPGAIDRARWHGEHVHVLRVAPDEALGIGATGADVDDPDAIVEPDAGFSVAPLGPEVVDVLAHTEWPIPDDPGSLAQGKVAGVPARLLIGDPTILVVQTAYRDELMERLGW
jgi:hypothetical protein